jgi:hypothetical protein
VTTSTRYTSCGTAANGFTPSGPISTFITYDAAGNPLGVDDPDAVAGNTAHQGCTVGSAAFSTCIPYDGTFDALPVSVSNALGQVSTTSHGGQAVADSSGHGSGGAWTGGVTPGAPGLVPGDGDTAMSFDGATGEVDTGYSAASVTSYSAEAWRLAGPLQV